MRLVLSFLSLLAFYPSTGQNYVHYHNQINQANLLALNGDFAAASLQYKNTFDQYDFEFARDCINALEVSSKTNHDTLTAFFARCALRRGVPLSFLIKLKALDTFRYTANWQEVVMETESLHEQYLQSINIDVRASINQMFKEDQALRKQYYSWYNIIKRPWLNKKWEVLNHQQMLRLYEITLEYGFPGEQLIGIDTPQDHPKIESRQLSAGMPIVILIHHYSQPNKSIDSTLFPQLFTGYLHPQHFATICDFEVHFGEAQYPNFGYYGLRFGPENGERSTYNSKRQKIGLPTHDEIIRLNKSSLFTKFWNQLK